MRRTGRRDATGGDATRGDATGGWDATEARLATSSVARRQHQPLYVGDSGVISDPFRETTGQSLGFEGALLAAIDDEAVREIVGGHGDADPISGKHPDVVTPHTAGKLGANHRTALVHLDGVLAAAESVLNDALHLEKVALAHVFRKSKWVLRGVKTRADLARPKRERKVTHLPPSRGWKATNAHPAGNEGGMWRRGRVI